METQIFIRKPFDVNAVQVTPDNAAEIAEWCKGQLGQADYKLMGQTVKLVAVQVPGNGPKKGKMVDALIGSWVVEHNNNFRVYRDQQFQETFIARVALDDPSQHFHIDDLVQERDESDGKVWQGRVIRADQVIVEYPFRGIISHDREELVRITKYSEETEKKWLLAAEADKGVPYNEAEEKINALRAAAEHAVLNGEIMVLPDEAPTIPVPVEEINGFRKGMRFIVTLEENLYSGQKGVVVGLGYDGVRILGVMDGGHDDIAPIPFTSDEITWIIPVLHENDMVELSTDFLVDDLQLPVGTTARVTRVDVDLAGGTDGTEVQFADGRYHTFDSRFLKKI